MTIIAETDDQATQHLPWPAMAATLTAFGALYAAGGRFIGLPILGLLLLATYLTPKRLPAWATLGWALRAIFFTILVAAAGPMKFVRGSIFGGAVLYEPAYTNLFGYLCAAELVMRAWVHRRGGPSHGEMMFLSALVFMVATNTYERRAISILAPLYVVFLTLSLRRFRPKAAAMRQVRRLRWSVAHGAALAIVLAMGFAISMIITSYGEQITRWYVSFAIKPRSTERIGLSTTPQLTAMFNPRATLERVMIVKGSLPDPHLRAMAFDTYTRGAWRSGLTGGTYARVGPEDLHEDAPGRRMHVRRLADELNLLYLPLNAMGVLPTDEMILERDAFGSLHVAGDEHPEANYEVIVSDARDQQGPAALPLDEQQRTAALMVPDEVAPAVREIAQRVAGNLAPRDRVSAIETYLRANHAYSLTSDPGDADPISTFLIEKKAGHCQYFASAAVILLRCAGVPARYVNGYYAHESQGGDVTIVRQRDAHAWAECWIDGTGWVTVEATPAAGTPAELFAPASWWRRTRERIDDAWSAMRAWFAGFGWTKLLGVAGALTALIASVQALRGWRRNRRAKSLPEQGYLVSDAELAAIGARFDRLLQARGAPCAEHQTWREHLEQLRAGGGDGVSVADVPQLLSFVRQYNEARFRSCESKSIAELRDILEALDQARTKQ